MNRLRLTPIGHVACWGGGPIAVVDVHRWAPALAVLLAVALAAVAVRLSRRSWRAQLEAAESRRGLVLLQHYGRRS